MKLLRTVNHGEDGQILVFAALALTMLLAFSGLSMDVGLWLQARTNLQADADAMALAGAQMLCAQASCDPTAVTTARAYAPKNGVETSEILSVTAGVNCAGGSTANHDWITVRLKRKQATYFAKVIGIGDADIITCATAGKYALGGFAGVVPFGIEDDCLGSGVFNTTYTLKYDSDTSSANGICDAGKGNFGALAVDTSGAGSGCGGGSSDDEELKFKQALCFGANRALCAESSTDCDGEADDDSCSGSNPAATESCTETGNMTGPIKEGIGYRFSNTSSECNEWSEVVSGGGLNAYCNPWIPGGPASMRVIMIPIVDGLWGDGGRHEVDIVGFAIFFLETFDPHDCTGHDCDITGRFIKTQMSTNSTGTYGLGSNSLVTQTKLIN